MKFDVKVGDIFLVNYVNPPSSYNVVIKCREIINKDLQKYEIIINKGMLPHAGNYVNFTINEMCQYVTVIKL